MFWMAQSLMTVYPVAWIAADLGFMSPVVEQVWVYTVLDVTCKLAFVWGCIVIRLAEAFPAMHVSFAGCHQVLDASYDIRLTMDMQFQISGLHGKKALLQHYVGESEVVGKNFLDLWLVESERTKVIDVMRMLDQNGGETLSPKVTLTLKGKAGNVSIECVVSSMQSGLRVLAINFVSQSEGDDASCNSAMDDRLRSACTPRFSSKDQGDSDSPQEAGEPGTRAPGPKGRSVSRSHEKVGFLLDDELEPAFLADVLLAGCPIIGVSEGFLKLSLYPRDKVVGTSISFLEEGIPEYLISKSTAKNLKSYCEACRLCLPSRSYRRWSGTSSLVSGKSEKTSLSSAKSYRSKASVGDILVVQPNRRQDSSLFVNSCYCSLVILRGRPYILGVPSILGEGALLRAQPNELEKNRQESRLKIQTISDALQTRLSDAWGSSEGSAVSECSADSWKLTEDDEVAISQEDGLFNWFSEQLQDHCILLNWNRTAVRREHADLPIGCLVFSRLPVPWTTITGPSGSREGLRFSVRVDEVTTYFDGLPLMGFTEREPKNGEDLYPKQAQCLGRSVLIGRNGLAFARDKWTHTQIGFKQPPQDELQTWREDPVEPATPSQPLDIAVDRGDTLECCWTVDGWLCMKQGEKTISSFNIGRSPQRSTAYYAAVDVCFSVLQLTLLPPSPIAASDSEQPVVQSERSFDFVVPSDAIETNITNSVLIPMLTARAAISAAVANCNFCITVADPSQPDCPLIAVSQEFARMTGFEVSSIVGRNCRFLSRDVQMKAEDVMSLRKAQQSGERVTLFLQNRRQSGELFLNMLDMCGLRVAQDLDTGKYIWFVVGVQADVSGLSEDEMPQDLSEELRHLASNVREKLAQQLRDLALQGAQDAQPRSFSQDALEKTDGIPVARIQVLEQPEWLGPVSTSTVLKQPEPNIEEGPQESPSEDANGLLVAEQHPSTASGSRTASGSLTTEDTEVSVHSPHPFGIPAADKDMDKDKVSTSGEGPKHHWYDSSTLPTFLVLEIGVALTAVVLLASWRAFRR